MVSRILGMSFTIGIWQYTFECDQQKEEGRQVARLLGRKARWQAEAGHALSGADGGNRMPPASSAVRSNVVDAVAIVLGSDGYGYGYDGRQAGSGYDSIPLQIE